jgi:TolA-binding protein
VFILTDQLESRKVNEQKVATPQLPTVKLHPENDSASSDTASTLAPATTMVAPESEVEYAGEAAKSNRSRPVLRLHGEHASTFSERPAAEGEERAGHATRESQGSVHAGRNPDMEAFRLYRRSYEALRQGQHDGAVDGFREFLRRYATHDLADNAQYWLGECYYDSKDFPAAVREFRRVVERFPHGNKVPDACSRSATAIWPWAASTLASRPSNNLSDPIRGTKPPCWQRHAWLSSTVQGPRTPRTMPVRLPTRP